MRSIVRAHIIGSVLLTVELAQARILPAYELGR